MKIGKFIAGIITVSVILLAANGCGTGVETPVDLAPEEPAPTDIEPKDSEETPVDVELKEPEPSELEPVEIREYEGEDLSSIKDFRENSIKGPQFVNIEDYSLRITGLVTEPVDFTYDEVIDNHEQFKKVVTLDCVEGWSVTLLWEGVLVRDLINEAEALPDAKVVIFKAYDGYTTSLPVDYIMSNDILLAYKMNEVTLPPERGFPFELVAESKWGYKWIKWVTEIQLSDDVNYRGFWESRGYANDADLDKGFFD